MERDAAPGGRDERVGAPDGGGGGAGQRCAAGGGEAAVGVLEPLALQRGVEGLYGCDGWERKRVWDGWVGGGGGVGCGEWVWFSLVPQVQGAGVAGAVPDSAAVVLL